jgi:uncharacterized protein DUF932
MSTLKEPEFMDSSIDNIRAKDMPFNFKKADRTWEKQYGYVQVPLNVRDADRKVYDDRKLKGLFQHGFYRKPLSRNYVLLPNEECDNIVHSFIKHYGSEYGLYLFKTYTAYNGDAQYWEVRSKKQFTIENSHEKNDKVQLGFIVSNSVGCNVPFGLKVFTFRLVCQNGAIAKGSDLLSLKIKHYGKDSLRLMTDSLQKRVHDIMHEGQELMKQYERAARLKLRLEAAKMIARRISKKYLPDYFEFEKKKLSLTRTPTLWQTFNDLTEEIWHEKELSFLTKGDMTTHLHAVMKKEILVAAR